MTKRQIVQFDQEKCDGCGRCVPACAEGAIRIVDGKAALVADTHCDGLGACLGECPRGAIAIIEREAEAFDESLLSGANHAGKSAQDVPVLRRSSARHDPASGTACEQTVAHGATGGCPGMAMRDLRLNVTTSAAAGGLDSSSIEVLRTRGLREPRPSCGFAAAAGRPPQPTGGDGGPPALAHWPIQLRLVPPDAPFLRQADLFLVANCVPFACAGFHEKLLRSRPIVIGCPKLDDARAYVDKLAEMLVRSEIRSLTVVHMEVPCCTKLLRIATEAVRLAGAEIPLHDVTITINGEMRPDALDR